MPVRTLRRDDHDAVVETLCSAFADDPLPVWACGERRGAAAALVFSATFRVLSPLQTCFGDFDDASRLRAVAFFQPPGTTAGVARYVAAGLWRLPHRTGIASSTRLIRALGVAEALKERVMGERRYWYLDTLGVHPSAQRRGIGPQLVEAAEDDLRARDDAPFLLLTHVPANVPRYRRLGFELCAESSVPKSPLVLFAMRKDQRCGFGPALATGSGSASFATLESAVVK